MPSSISNQDVGIVDENQVCEKVVVENKLDVALQSRTSEEFPDVLNAMDKENRGKGAAAAGLTPDEAAAFEELSQQLKDYNNYNSNNGTEDLNSNPDKEIINASQEPSHISQANASSQDANENCNGWKKKQDGKCEEDHSISCSDNVDNLSGISSFHCSSAGETINSDARSTLTSYQLKIKNLLENGLSGNYWQSSTDIEISTNGRPKRSRSVCNKSITLNKKSGSFVSELTDNTKNQEVKLRKRSIVNEDHLVKKTKKRVLQQKLNDHKEKMISSRSEENEERNFLNQNSAYDIPVEVVLKTAVCIPKEYNPESYQRFRNVLTVSDRRFNRNIQICSDVLEATVQAENSQCVEAGLRKIRKMKLWENQTWESDDEEETFRKSSGVNINVKNYLRDRDIYIPLEAKFTDDQLLSDDDSNPSVDFTICKCRFCALGCVCESLDHGRIPSLHCGMPECMLQCNCQNSVFRGCFKKKDIHNALPAVSETLNTGTTSCKLSFGERMGILKRAAPCKVMTGPVWKENMYEVFVSTRSWTRQFMANELRGTKSCQWEFDRPASSSKEPVADFQKPLDLIVNGSGQILAYIWNEETNLLVPKTRIYCNKNDEILTWPVLFINKPCVDEVYLFYELPNDLVKLSKLWLIEIGAVVDVTELLLKLSEYKGTDAFRYSLSCSHLRSSDSPAFVFIVPLIPRVLIYGPVKKANVMVGSSAQEYVKWFFDNNKDLFTTV